VKEIAKKFKLTPMQVKGRLQYTRKKVLGLLTLAAKRKRG
jgi:hypothetical protein